MDLEQIKELMQSVEASKLKKFSLKKGDFELLLEKEGDAPAASPQYAAPYLPPRPAPVEHHPHEPPFHSDHTKGRGHTRSTEADGKYVTSPMVGTFYATPGPDQPAFVKIGDKIDENTVVCIIEAMKVMNEVKAGVSGTVAEVLVDHAQPVEFGTKIFRIV